MAVFPVALDEQNWPTKPITSPEALLSCNKMAILWAIAAAKLWVSLTPSPATCRLMGEVQAAE